MTELTPWYKDNVVMQNIFLTIGASCVLVADVLTQTPVLTWPGVFGLIAGICGIIIRVFFSQKMVDVSRNRNLIASQSVSILEDKPGAG